MTIDDGTTTMGADRHAKERRKEKERYVKYPISIKRNYAWSRLSFCARQAWFEIGFIYNGSNNGQLCVSSRRLAKDLGASPSHAARAIKELINWGFLDQVKASSFGKKKLSSEYRLTHLRCDVTNQPPNLRFMRISKNLSSESLIKSGVLSPASGTI